MLPIGLSDIPNNDTVKLYCPRCQDLFLPKSSRHNNTDGAYFGSGFPHMLFLVQPELRPKKPPYQFVPRLYGFKISPLAYELQMQAAASFKQSMTPVVDVFGSTTSTTLTGGKTGVSTTATR